MPNTTTLGESLRSPIDGTEYVRMATTGANWKAQLGTATWVFGGLTNNGAYTQTESITGGPPAVWNITQTQPNSSFNNDGGLFVNWTLSASSATNDLLTTPIILTITNSLTGGGHLQNARNFDLKVVNSSGATIDEVDCIYIEGSNSGTVTTFVALRVTTTLGAATAWNIFDDSGANFHMTGAMVIGSSTSVGSAGSIKATDQIVSTGSTAGVGYATGAGGTVTQLTSRTTAVTLNKICGQITLFTAAPTAGTTSTFTVNNTVVGNTDVVHCSITGGSGSNVYTASVSQTVNGTSFNVTVTNVSGSTSDAPIVNFAIIKSVSA